MSKVIKPPESVYNLIPKKEVQIEKTPRYVSKFRPAVVLEYKSSKDAMRTMGPAKEEVSSPAKYLKKHSKEPRLSDNTCRTVKKPPVTARPENPPVRIHTKQKTAVAAPMKPASVDSHKGHKQVLESSGLVPNYIMKKDYGEVPQYLLQRIREQQRAQEEFDNFVKDQQEQGAIQRLPDEERQAILEGLKRNWDELHHEYQGLPLIIDTLSRKAQKQRLEEALKQLEKDITG